MLIDLVQLRTFVAVAEEKHLTRAAERLHVSQSAASAHVRSVEEALDVQLFVRTNRSLELTRAGELLLERAKALLNEATEFASFSREIRGKTEGWLIVASGSEPGYSRVGEIVATLQRTHPLISVNLLARPSVGARQGLKTGEVDIGLILGRPTDAGFTCYELTSVPFTVAGPAAWKRQIERADWAELAAMPWISPADSGMAYSSMLDTFFRDRGLRPNTVARFDNAALARAMVEAGVGITLMREEHARHGVEQGTLAISPIARARLPLSMAHLSSRRNDPLVRAFVDAAAQVLPDMKITSAHE